LQVTPPDDRDDPTLKLLRVAARAVTDVALAPRAERPARFKAGVRALAAVAAGIPKLKSDPTQRRIYRRAAWALGRLRGGVVGRMWAAYRAFASRFAAG
jgi:hypothetical protein